MIASGPHDEVRSPVTDGAALSGTAVIYADGGSRGNPGPAGYGAVVLAPDGTVLAERAAGLGVASNNVAEYSGLIAGLRAAGEQGTGRVQVRMDSKLVVEQMSGRWKVKSPELQVLAGTARDLVAGFDLVEFSWIPRKQNSHADRLANEAMDAQADGREWASPTPSMPPTPSSRVPDALDSAALRGSDPDPEWTDPAAGPPAITTTPATAGTAGGTVLLVIRHGQTTWGVENRYAGREDVPLTPRGRAEAAAVGRRLAGHRLSRILTSPLARCRTTAGIIAGATGLPTEQIQVEDGLIDGTLGEWTGFGGSEIGERWPAEYATWQSDPGSAPPGGESYDEIRDRVRSVVRRVLEDHPGEVIALVTHAVVAKMLVVTAFGAPSTLAYRTRIDNCSVSTIAIDPSGAPVVCSMNDTGHLY